VVVAAVVAAAVVVAAAAMAASVAAKRDSSSNSSSLPSRFPPTCLIVGATAVVTAEMAILPRRSDATGLGAGAGTLALALALLLPATSSVRRAPAVGSVSEAFDCASTLSIGKS
jgi:hypothetical protein